jgi:hypothetical protein
MRATGIQVISASLMAWLVGSTDDVVEPVSLIFAEPVDSVRVGGVREPTVMQPGSGRVVGVAVVVAHAVVLVEP